MFIQLNRNVIMMYVFKILCWLHEPGRQKGEKKWKSDVKQSKEEEKWTRLSGILWLTRRHSEGHMFV